MDPRGAGGGRAGARRKVPYLLTTHGSDVTLIAKFRWLRPLAGPLFRRAAARTAVSTYLQSVMADLFDVDSELLPMPYDDSKFTPQEPMDRKPPIVTCIGR